MGDRTPIPKCTTGAIQAVEAGDDFKPAKDGRHMTICLNDQLRPVELVWFDDKWTLLYPELEFPPDVRIPDHLTWEGGKCRLYFGVLSNWGGSIGMNLDEQNSRRDFVEFEPTTDGHCTYIEAPERFTTMTQSDRANAELAARSVNAPTYEASERRELALLMAKYPVAPPRPSATEPTP